MGQSLKEIAQTLRDTNKKVQLLYAFNGVGKTRLSREFKALISPKSNSDEDNDAKVKIIYYNAFTEDLFYWDNDLDEDRNRKIIIRPNGFTNWVLKEQGKESNIITHFQHYTNDKLTPKFNEKYDEISFSIEAGNEEIVDNIKISKGEENCLIWCVFYSLLEQVVEVLNVAEPNERETDQFDDLEYVFIDDPVSSLDENHLIELAVNIAELIKSSQSELKFIITTHNPLFYNVLYNELSKAQRQLLKKLEDGTYEFIDTKDSPFSYHLFLLSELEKVTNTNDDNVQKYHFNFLRQLLEKTSTFLGYGKWEELLPQEARAEYYKLIINLCSHSAHNGEEVAVVKENDKRG